MGNINGLSMRNQLNDIARMAYGSGLFEKTSGGKGNIGLITDADGRPRAIKFNTHYRERGGVATDEQVKSSNALRAQLITIAQELNPAVVDELRTKLGLGKDEDPSAGKSLLTRKIAAEAVKLIDAKAMGKVEEDCDTASLRSYGGTKFDEARVYARHGVSTKTLEACGMSAADFEASMSAVAAKFSLSDAKKQVVRRATASYLTAIAEEGRTGQLDQNGRVKEGLPSKAELMQQISEGAFGGTYWGLVHVRAIRALDYTVDAVADNVFESQALSLSCSLEDDECADAAYFIAKMGTGARDESVFDNMLDSLTLKTLVEHRDELMALHRKNGTLTINDMWKSVVGRNAPKRPVTTATNDFKTAVNTVVRNKINRDCPKTALEKWGDDDLGRFTDRTCHIMGSVIQFGVSVDVAARLFLGEDPGDVRCSHTASAYDVDSTEYKKANEDDLFNIIAGDINRIQGGPSSITVGDGAGAHRLEIPSMAGERFANANTPGLMKAMKKLLGGDKIADTVLNQFKTMCYMCNQAGNIFLLLAGKVAGEYDHYPLDKSFTLQKDGSVLYTASGESDGVTHTVKYQIEKDGTSHLVDYSRSKVSGGA